MSQHTPTPWIVKHSDTIYSTVTDRLIADCEFTPHSERPHAPRSEDEANAAYIVNAVNNHERLLEALKDAQKNYSMLYAEAMANTPDRLRIVDMVADANREMAQAIAQAEGGS